MAEYIQFDTWGKITRAQLEGMHKQQMKLLFDRIVAASADVAKQKGFDLVVTEQRLDVPENLAQITVDQLKAILMSRNTLYVNPKIDVTNDVIAALDAKYKASGPATATAVPAPAPAPEKK
jgi:Skp family chaperone for outer membrane proteins